MNLQLAQSTAKTFRVLCPFDWRPTAVTAGLYKPDGDAVAASLTTALGRQKQLSTGTYGDGQSDETKLTLVDGGQTETDFYRGDEIVIGDQDYTEAQPYDIAIVAKYVYAASVATQDLYTMRNLTHSYTGAADMWVWTRHHSVTVTAVHTATLDRNYRLVLTWTHPDTSTYVTEELVDIVTRLYQRTLSEVRLRERLPAIANDLTNWCQSVGGSIDTAMDRGWDMVVTEIQSRGYRADLIRDHHQLEAPTAYAIKLHLAENGVAPPHWRPQVAEYEERSRIDFMRSVKLMMNNLTWYDEDDDNKSESTEEDKPAGVVYASR